MYRSIFSAECLGCGVDCNFDDLICESCVAELKEITCRCAGCGYPLSVPSLHCARCRNKSLINHYYSDYFYSGAFKVIIRRIKYNWRLRGIAQFGRLCRFTGLNFNDYDYVVPIPYHFLRRFRRFVQPVDVLSKEIAARGGNVLNALVRIKHTDYQSRLTKAKRLQNVKGVFETAADVHGAKILLFDDIFTTGATVYEAAATLKSGGASKIDVYTLLSGEKR